MNSNSSHGSRSLISSAPVKRLVSDFIGRRPIRTTSLIVSIFGDVVSQHGNAIWLGSLVRALAPLEISERLVRTSVFRLVREGWIESERSGRRSYYRFSDYGRHEYERAARRIYALEDSRWNGHWQLLMLHGVAEPVRAKLKRSLHWQGFRQIAATIYAKPGESGPALQEILEEFQAADRVILMRTEVLPATSTQRVRELVQENWHLEELTRRYAVFLSRFKPLQQWLQRGRSLPPEEAFIARILLIHNYRRVLLQDTPIPDELLPRAWPGATAKRLTGELYRALGEASVAYITSSLESGNGALPAPGVDFQQRFSGIQEPAP